MKAQELKKDIWWVGAVDWTSRDFHGYSLSPDGTTYNAFLVLDEKVTLFDTVKPNHSGEMLCNLAQVLGGDLTKVDYLVINHLEPDHAGAIVEIVERCKPEKIFVSPMGKGAMETLYHMQDKNWPVQVVKTGDSVSIGKRTLHFLETRMLHWPDNMLTYIPEEKMAICSDAFGQNWATSERFADQVDKHKLKALLREYYANIVNPYSPQVLKTFEALGQTGWEIEYLFPDHGLLYRGQDVAFALSSYAEFARQEPQPRALLFYDTMWHATENMAHAIASGLVDSGIEVEIMHLKANHHSKVMTAVSRCGAVLVGSPTHNNGILPLVAGMLQYMKGLRPKNKVGGVFGSFGWSGESVKVLKEWMDGMGIPVVGDGVKVKHTPTHDDYKTCYEYGKQVAAELKAKIAACSSAS